MKTRTLMLVAIVLLAACKQKGSQYEVVNDGKNGLETARIDTLAISSPKLVKTAEMNLKVKNVQQTSDSIVAVTKQYKGMVLHHQSQSPAIDNKDLHISNDSVKRISSVSTTAEMTIKIPSARLEDFMNSVGKIGIRVDMSRVDIEDKSLDFLSAQLKFNNRKELVNQQKKGKVVIKDPSSVLLLKDDLIDEQIGNSRIDDAVKYSTVNLHFYQNNTISTETIANDDPSAYNIPIFQRLGLAFYNGWNIFVNVVIGIANLWVFILAGVIIWFCYKAYKKKPIGI